MIRTNISRYEKQIAIRAKRQGNTITMKWTTWPNGKPSVDPTTGATPATGDKLPVESSTTFRAFFHEIAPSTSAYRIYAEIQTGDAILDLPSSISIDDLENPYFIVNGEKWVQKQTDAALTRSWDFTIGDHKLLRSVLLRKAT
jgi:hypothetical protein